MTHDHGLYVLRFTLMKPLIYRPLPESDYEQFARVEAEAFGVEPRDVLARLAGDDGAERRALYVDGRIVAQLELYPLEVLAGMHALPFGGIGGVASPPEARRRGYVGRLLHELCDELRARGISLSILHPFRAAFYRQFGWATFEERKQYSGAIEIFAPFRHARLDGFAAAGVEQIAELDAIYRAALLGRFGPIVRDDRWWRREVLRPEKGDVYSYIWRDQAGQGRSYVVYSWQKRPAGLAMVCREAAALDPLARAQLFGFMADHDNQCREVVFRAPADAPVQALMPETLHCEMQPNFMLRLLDLAEALGAYRAPRDVSGRLRLAISDGWLAHNQGVYELEIADGTIACQRLPDGAEAGLACDVGVLAQLYARYLRPRSAAAFGLLDARDRASLALAERLFAGLAPYSSDHF
jgi:predicted acetyltransferase